MLDSADLVAFAPSTDLERSRAFYTDVAGLEFIEQSPFACVFRSGGTMLRVTAVQEFTPHPFTVLGWAVADIRTAVAELRARGVEFPDVRHAATGHRQNLDHARRQDRLVPRSGRQRAVTDRVH